MGRRGLYFFGSDRDKCQGVVNTVMNLQGPKNGGEFLDQVSMG